MKKYEFSFQLDEKTKKMFEVFCREHQLSKNELLTCLVSKSVGRKALPFKLEKDYVDSVVVKRSLKGNFKISFTCEEWMMEEFKEICTDNGVTMSKLIVIFIKKPRKTPSFNHGDIRGN